MYNIYIIYTAPAQSSRYVVRLSAPTRLALQRYEQLKTKKSHFFPEGNIFSFESIFQRGGFPSRDVSRCSGAGPCIATKKKV